MKSFAIAAFVVALVPAALGQTLTVASPSNVVACEPFKFTWTGGTPPYFLTLIPSQGAAPIKQFPQTSDLSLTWTVDLQAGTNFNADIKDSTGTNGFSAQATIIAGSSTTCLNTTVVEGSGGASGGASSTGSSSAGGSASASGSGTASGSSASPSATGSSSSNGASISTVSAFGMTGVLGLAAALLL